MLDLHDGAGGCHGAGGLVRENRHQILYQLPVSALVYGTWYHKHSAELDAALSEYDKLKAQAADFDPDELAMAQLEIRPQKEASAESKIQAAYGDKYDFWTMIGAKRDVAEMLGEEEPRSILERLRRKEYEKQRAERQDVPQCKKNKDRGWER